MLHQVDKMFYKDFSVFLIEEQMNTNSTLNKKQVKIITILNHAVSEFKLKIGIEYKEKYKFRETQVAKFPLRPEELALLRSHTCATDYQQLVLDAFLLACETGLRFSDIQQLQPAHINSFVTDSEIIQYIDLKNIKGSQTNTMPLSNYANSIIDKYMKPEGYLFEFKYSQSASRCLKDIFADPKLNLNRPCETIKMQGSKIERNIVPLHDIISFHMGRNTYITRLLSSSIAPVHVQGNAGHSDIAITMGYFRNDDINRFRETLKVLNEKKPDVDTSSPS
jgi:integrase